MIDWLLILVHLRWETGYRVFFSPRVLPVGFRYLYPLHYFLGATHNIVVRRLLTQTAALSRLMVDQVGTDE